MQIAPNVIAAADDAVNALMNEVKGITAVVVSSEDGFEVASRVENTAQVARLAAMASSLAALGMVAGDESQLGSCDNILIGAENGHLIMLQVRHPQVELILSIVANKQTIVGQALYFGKIAVKAMERA